jgi:hypothetical protein
MQQVNNSILLQSLTPEQLSDLIKSVFKSELEDFKKEFNNQTAKEELMSREQVIDFLQIDASTLVRYQNNGKVNVYKFAHKNFYKRSEILESLIQLKK